MPFAKPITLVTLSAALTLSACKGSQSNKLSDAYFEKALAVDARTVTAGDVDKALAALSLADAETSKFHWDEVTRDGGTVTFKGWRTDDKKNSAQSLSLIGLHVAGDKMGFDKLVIDDLRTSYSITDSKLSITGFYDDLILVGPKNPDAFLKNFNAEKSELIFGQGFEAGKMGNVSFSIDTAKIGQIGRVSFAPGSSANKKNVVMADFDMNLADLMKITSPNEPFPLPEFSMTMKTSSMVNVSDEYFKTMAETYSGKMSPSGSMMASVNYDSAITEDFRMDFGSAQVVIPSMTATGKQSGDVFTVKQVIEPSKVTFSPENPFAKEMGITEMVFDGGVEQTVDSANDKMSFDNFYVDFKDQFKLDMDMKMSGIMAMMDAMNEMDPNNPDEQAIMENMMDIQYVKLAYDDHALADRIWSKAAEMQGTDVDSLKGQAKGFLGLASLSAQTPEQGEMIGSMVSALTGFIDNGGTLTFEMKPEDGFSFAQLETMQNPDVILNKLGLSLTHSK